jgi:hypothetical protein
MDMCNGNDREKSFGRGRDEGRGSLNKSYDLKVLRTEKGWDGLS